MPDIVTWTVSNVDRAFRRKGGEVGRRYPFEVLHSHDRPTRQSGVASGIVQSYNIVEDTVCGFTVVSNECQTLRYQKAECYHQPNIKDEV